MVSVPELIFLCVCRCRTERHMLDPGIDLEKRNMPEAAWTERRQDNKKRNGWDVAMSAHVSIFVRDRRADPIVHGGSGQYCCTSVCFLMHDELAQLIHRFPFPSASL